MKEPRVTDAEFEVISGPPPQKPWNGLGVPPRWVTWNPLQKIVYVVVWAGLMSLVVWGARFVANIIVPLH